MVTQSTLPERSGRWNASAHSSRGAQPIQPSCSRATLSIPRLTSAPMTSRPGWRRPRSDEPLPVHRSSTTRASSGTSRHMASRQAVSRPSVISWLRKS